jgi:hypothetical protein
MCVQYNDEGQAYISSGIHCFCLVYSLLEDSVRNGNIIAVDDPSVCGIHSMYDVLLCKQR